MGNGKGIWFWHDNWHTLGPLVQKFGSRIVYDGASSLNARMKTFVDHNGWIRPRALSNDLIRVVNEWPTYTPNINRDDEVEWVLTADKKFSVKAVWNKLRRRNPIVSWANLLWHKDNIPRCSFINWLACRDRLRTKAKLCRWGVLDNNQCVLCAGNVEDRDHLFFQCSYSSNIWNAVLARFGLSSQCISWDAEVEQLGRWFQGRSLLARTGKVALNVVAYFLWQERHQRIFSGQARIEQVVLREIENYVVARMCTVFVGRTYRNWPICCC